MLYIQLYYFDKKGEQKFKELKAKTKKGILSKFKKFAEENEIYHIAGVSPQIASDELINSVGWK